MLDELIREVQESGSTKDSVLAFIAGQKGLIEQLRANAADPVAIAALAAELDAQQRALADAIAVPGPAPVVNPDPVNPDPPPGNTTPSGP